MKSVKNIKSTWGSNYPHSSVRSQKTDKNNIKIILINILIDGIDDQKVNNFLFTLFQLLTLFCYFIKSLSGNVSKIVGVWKCVVVWEVTFGNRRK